MRLWAVQHVWGILPTDPVVMDDPVIKDIAAKKGITPAQVYTKVHSSIHLLPKTVYKLIESQMILWCVCLCGVYLAILCVQMCGCVCLVLWSARYLRLPQEKINCEALCPRCASLSCSTEGLW